MSDREQFLISAAYTQGFEAGLKFGRDQAVADMKSLRDDCEKRGWPHMVRGLNRGINHLEGKANG